ncbi:unnamed protein product [Angiostrongylus costaricensis]|uniref:Fatty acid hydroxylase domain-containing protein n=1 Tax=Angiostrongylus costaricensis TaxID=334426 RepID=A0A3P7HHE1_ANGCS|nr:unnamed protein product [Angiostrongylus costaricensis]
MQLNSIIKPTFFYTTVAHLARIAGCFRFGGRFLSAAVYSSVYERIHIIELPKDSATTWILCFFTQDLVYYLGHRAVHGNFSHKAGVLWSFHQMHHSSEYYNLSTALRQGVVQDFVMVLFDLLQALVIPPNIFIVHRYLNLLYQFWLHSNAVPYLGPLEYFLNTPSSHRVHHGRNPYCIDKNYGGTLIIWDRLFGTYEPERRDEEIAYGLVTPVASFSQIWWASKIQSHQEIEFQVKAALWPPGYFPGMQTKNFFLWLCMKDSTEGIPEVYLYFFLVIQYCQVGHRACCLRLVRQSSSPLSLMVSI